MTYKLFSEVIADLREKLLYESDLVHSRRWQGQEIADNPNMACMELTHTHFVVDMEGFERDHEAYENDIQPDLPWAADHFAERVCGWPLNPGTQFAEWPWNAGKGAESFLDERGKFNHNYMERYWPRYAGAIATPTKNVADHRSRMKAFHDQMGSMPAAHRGILYEYGDLNDVIDLLVDDGLTRQAYLPVWFPEDTGGGSKRTPCTIGYHFLMRGDRLDVNYHIRSCDFVKHFRNDLYLTVRLVLWMLTRLSGRDPRWKTVMPGKFVMQIGSLHSFKPDWEKI